jgi:hypothetical protein
MTAHLPLALSSSAELLAMVFIFMVALKLEHHAVIPLRVGCSADYV